MAGSDRIASFEEFANQDVLRLTMSDGALVEGSYLPQAGMHFIHVRDGSPIGRVEGPLDPAAISDIERLRTWEDIKSERHDRLRGAPYPGRLPETREDYEYRLQTLARAVAAEDEPRRKGELLYQFNDVADEVALAQAKRAWVLAEGRFSLTSNAPPTMEDLWFADVASPSLFRRPRSQDFDPDPRERRKRIPLPDDVLAEERSIPNMLSLLRSAGFKAVVSLAGDPAYDRAEIQVDLAPGRLHRFVLDGRRRGSETSWRIRWAGNDTAAGMKRYRSLIRTEDYRRLLGISGIKANVPSLNRLDEETPPTPCAP